MEKRVLIIGHNVLDDKTAFGKTMLSFFGGWNTDSLAELYIHSEIPTSHCCEKYFRITDSDAIRAIFKRHSTGTVFTKEDVRTNVATSRTDTGLKNKFYTFGRKRTPLIYWARNAIWKLAKWNTKKLQDWLDEFQPEVIFFASGDYAFLYHIVYRIAKERNIPVVMYVCDDFYVNRLNPRSKFSKLTHHYLMKSVKKCISVSKSMVTICEQMAEAYKKIFNINIYTVYTGYSQKGEKYIDDGPIVYLGNLGFNRYKSLVDIGQTLKKISDETQIPLCLTVYSPENREYILDTLVQENGIMFRGAVSSREVKNIIAKSKMVVHTESFDPDDIHKVQYAISTKIADLLASGHCILAYGPENIASIDYLEENGAAVTAKNTEELETKLRQILIEGKDTGEIIDRAMALAERNHNSDKVQEQIYDIINK